MITQAGFKPNSIATLAQSYANVLPNGRVFDAKNITDSNLRKLLKGFSYEMQRYQNLVYELVTTYIPNLTSSIIPEWEQVLGIPDDCFSIEDVDDNTRRRNIIIKLAYMNLQTQADYIALASILGLTISISQYASSSLFTMTFPFYFGTKAQITSTWEITVYNTQQSNTFTLTFPVTFGSSDAALFECICQKQKPAHTYLIFNYVG